MRSTQSALWLTVKGWPHVPEDGSSQCPLMRVVAHSQPLTQEMSAGQQPGTIKSWRHRSMGIADAHYDAALQ